tara:strand:+ start:103 stop:804 length:702 start_codon:yes stop_codon:yes gene_type:complete
MGDFVEGFKRPDAGIATVEGSHMAGSRASQLSKKRSLEQTEFEDAKKKMKDDRLRGSKKIDDKFSGSSLASQAESTFSKKTVGLVTASEFKKLKEESDIVAGGGEIEGEKERKEKLAEDILKAEEKEKKRIKKEKKLKKKKMLNTLSFGGDEELENDDEDEKNATNNKKNPNVNTDFLPDKNREMAKKELEEKLKLEWIESQSAVKNERLQIVYSYWDGSGNRREIEVNKVSG